MSYKKFQNLSCEYYPCHKIPPEDFNCFGCYCPLYHMENCGGNFKVLSNGVKDCMDCLLPHKNPDYIINILRSNND